MEKAPFLRKNHLSIGENAVVARLSIYLDKQKKKLIQRGGLQVIL